MASDMQLGADKMWDNISESLNSLGEKRFMNTKSSQILFLDLSMKASELKRAEVFELTGAKTSTLTSQVMDLKEKMENEYISIYNKMDEEKLKIQQNMAIYKNENSTQLEEEEAEHQVRCQRHEADIMKLAGMVTGNGTQHRESVRGGSVISARVATMVRETEENFAKLLFVQSRSAAHVDT